MFWDWIGYIRVEYPSKNTDGFYQMALLRRIFKKKKKLKMGRSALFCTESPKRRLLQPNYTDVEV